LKRDKSGIGWTILLVFIILIIIVIAVITFYENPTDQKSPVTLTASLEPSTVKVGENSRLTLKFKNQDLESHHISCIFTANPKIIIYSGNNPLVNNEYSFNLEASDPTEERILTVQSLLGEFVSSSDYVIHISLRVDGVEIVEQSQKLTLSVKES
jgi:hypothetical protein